MSECEPLSSCFLPGSQVAHKLRARAILGMHSTKWVMITGGIGSLWSDHDGLAIEGKVFIGVFQIYIRPFKTLKITLVNEEILEEFRNVVKLASNRQYTELKDSGLEWFTLHHPEW